MVVKFETSEENMSSSYFKLYIFVWEPLNVADGCSFGSCFKFSVMICDRWDWNVLFWLNEGTVILKSSPVNELDTVLFIL